MESGRGVDGPLALVLGQDALALGLLESAQYLALLAASQGPHPSTEALSLVGAACMAAGEARRALHFLGHAQQAAQLSWAPHSVAGGAAVAAQPGGTALGPSAGPTAGGARALPGASALLASIADCHEQLGEWSEALAALERIPPSQRGARVWARLGRLHSRSAAGRLPAIAAYKACLRLCPFAIEAALALAELRVPADEVCSLLACMMEPAALERLLVAPQLQCLAAAQLSQHLDEAVETPAAGGRTGSLAASCSSASLDQGLQHPVPAEELPAGPGSGSPRAAPSMHARPESPQALSAALLQPPSSRSVPAASAEQDSRCLPVTAQLTGLLLGESPMTGALTPQGAPQEAGRRATVATQADEAEEDDASGVHTPPASSPVAAPRPSPFTPNSGQGTPAATSPALRQQAVPCQPSSSPSSPPLTKAQGSPAGQQEPQQLQPQPLAARRTLHPCLHPEPAASGQQSALASCGAPAPQRAARAPAHSPGPQDAQPRNAHQQRQGHRPSVPQPLLAAAQRILDCLILAVQLAAALAAEDRRRALPAAQQLLDVAPRHPLLLTLAAQCQADHVDTASALSLYERARQADPYSPAGAARHADLLRQAGDSVALAHLACQLSADAGLAGAGGRPEPWIVAAHAKELAGDSYEALGLLRRALERDPGCAEAHMQIGRLVHRARAAAGTLGPVGLSDFEAALRLRPSARAFRAAVDAALTADDLQAARRLARRALEAFPASPTCRLLHAQVLSRQPGRAGQAEAQLRQVLLEEPGDEEPALLLAVLLVQQGRHSEAEAILADQLATAPSMAGHVIAGRAAVERGDLEAAAGHFHAALGYSPLSELAAKGLQEVEALLAPAKAGTGSGSDSDSEGGVYHNSAPDSGTEADDPAYTYASLP